jgi:hypothetical protein
VVLRFSIYPYLAGKESLFKFSLHVLQVFVGDDLNIEFIGEQVFTQHEVVNSLEDLYYHLCSILT